MSNAKETYTPAYDAQDRVIFETGTGIATGVILSVHLHNAGNTSWLVYTIAGDNGAVYPVDETEMRGLAPASKDSTS